MQDDRPTVPNLRPYDAGAWESGGTPTWPVAGASPQRPSPSNGHPLLLGVSLVANGALLASLLGVLLLARAGFFSPPGGYAPRNALSSASATSSATPFSGWLQVAPPSVRLGCDGGQQTQFAVLANTGPEAVRWQVALSVPADQAGVEVSPKEGDLHAGASLVLQIQTKSRPVGQQGIIRFESAIPAAGPPPSLSYTTVGCQ